jgi:sulfur dioxygenase
MYFRMLLNERSAQITYLLADLEAAEAVLIDPCSADAGVIQAMLDEHHLKLTGVLCTDGHNRCQPQWAAWVSALPAAQGLPMDLSVSDGDTLVFGAEHLRVLATPGHTDLGMSYQWRDRVFCGDLLTPMACTERPGVSNASAWWDSVCHKVLNLPPETLLFNGHTQQAGSVSNVLTQRRHHPWFAGLRRDDALALMNES